MHLFPGKPQKKTTFAFPCKHFLSVYLLCERTFLILEVNILVRKHSFTSKGECTYESTHWQI